MTAFLAPDPIQSTQFIPGGNTPASGGLLFCYTAGTSTKQNTYTDPTASTARTNPIVLDSGGNIPGNGEVWIASTSKFVLAPSNDTDPPVSPYWTRDNITGVNDTSVLLAGAEWVPGTIPTFVSGTSLTLVGDQTAVYHVGRRIKTQNTGGLVYSTILTSSFAAAKTTLTLTNDSGSLDAGLSSVSYGLLSYVNPSLPTVGTVSGTTGANLVGWIRAAANAVAVTVKRWLDWQEYNVFEFMTIAQIADVQSNGGAIDVETSITNALAVAVGTLHFPAGTYTYATSPNFAKAQLHIRCEKNAIFNHTGTGNAFIADGGAAGSGVQGMTFENVRVKGNTNSTNGFYARSIHRSRFVHPSCFGCAATGSAFLLEWCVANEWLTPRVSSNESIALSPIPLYGMKLSRRASDNSVSTTQTLINPVFEGLTQVGGSGIIIDFAGGTTILGGTSESNTNGLIITANSYGNNFVEGLDLEANSSFDVDVDVGVYNTFIGVYGLGNTRFTGGGNRNVWIGGRINTLNMAAATFYNTFIGLSIITTLTDSSAAGFENEFFNCSLPGGINTVNKLRGGFATPWTPATYSTSITVDARQQGIILITANNGTAFTINAPTNPTRGQVLTFTISNTSGGVLGVITWDAVFKMIVFTSPTNGNNCSVDFYYNGTNWVQQRPQTLQIPN